MIRLMNQSVGELEHLPHYTKLIQEQARSILSADVELHVRGVRTGTYGPGTPPIDILGSHLGHFLAGVQIVEGAIVAEREGYDAVVLGCFHDPGLREARAAVRIPVVAACESALMTASTVGDAIGLVGIGPANVAFVRELVRGYGHADRVVDVVALPTAVNEHEIESSFDSDGAVIASFLVAARGLIARGADIIVPADNVLNTALANRKLNTVDGTPVLDAFANLLAHAEMRVRLQRATGLAPGRTVHPGLDDAAIDRLRTTAAAALTAGLTKGSGHE